jgi:hypothetical protein
VGESWQCLERQHLPHPRWLVWTDACDDAGGAHRGIGFEGANKMHVTKDGQVVNEARVLDFRDNPFTLVYEYAIIQNEPGRVNIHPVTYKPRDIEICANVTRHVISFPNSRRGIRHILNDSGPAVDGAPCHLTSAYPQSHLYGVSASTRIQTFPDTGHVQAGSK